MSENLKKHIPTIAIVAVIGILMAGLLMRLVHDNALGMNVGTFNFLIVLIPCVAMLVCAFFIMMTSQEIGSRLFIVVEAICLVAGLISLMVASVWQSDATISAALLANSAEGTTLTPVMKDPFAIVGRIFFFLLVPMIGSVAGAWVGSRLHPMSVDKNNKPSKKQQKEQKKKQKNSNKRRQG